MSDMARPPYPSVAKARLGRLGDPESDDLSGTTTPEERIAMVAVLSRRMWELRGERPPTYCREDMPVRVARLS